MMEEKELQLAKKSCLASILMQGVQLLLQVGINTSTTPPLVILVNEDISTLTLLCNGESNNYPRTPLTIWTKAHHMLYESCDLQTIVFQIGFVTH